MKEKNKAFWNLNSNQLSFVLISTISFLFSPEWQIIDSILVKAPAIISQICYGYVYFSM